MRDSGILPIHSDLENDPLINDKITDVKSNSQSQSFLHKIKDFYFPSGENYVDKMLQYPWYIRSLRFTPALFITLGLEILNGGVLNLNSNWLRVHFILVVFIPVISAIAGNIGLQTSSSISALVNLRKQDGIPIHFWKIFGYYFCHNLPNILLMSISMMGIAMVWDQASECRYDHSGIIFVGSIINMMIASVMGILTPLASHRVSFDPSSIAGPFETAVQDLVGFVIFIYLSKEMIELSPNSSCTLGNCLTLCNDSINITCVTTCKDFDCIKSCGVV